MGDAGEFVYKMNNGISVATNIIIPYAVHSEHRLSLLSIAIIIFMIRLTMTPVPVTGIKVMEPLWFNDDRQQQ